MKKEYYLAFYKNGEVDSSPFYPGAILADDTNDLLLKADTKLLNFIALGIANIGSVLTISTVDKMIYRLIVVGAYETKIEKVK